MKRKILDMIKCEKCNTAYDMEFFECPKCHTPNKDISSRALKNPLLFIDTFREIALLVTGIIGMFLIGAIVGLIFGMVIGSKGEIVTNLTPLQSLISLSITQFLVLIIMIAIMYPYLKYLAKSFLKYQSIIIGVLAGGFLILFSFAYGALISATIPDHVTNGNEASLIPLVEALPALSFFILVLVGPFVEELTYRVGLFGAANKWNKVVAYVLAVVIFSVMHISFSSGTDWISELIALPVYLIAAFVLAYIYDHFGFSASFTAHAINNLYAYLIYVIK
ncbi:MAG: type II CAAX endopeptidase family protein [Bacilli bacterium]